MAVDDKIAKLKDKFIDDLEKKNIGSVDLADILGIDHDSVQSKALAKQLFKTKSKIVKDLAESNFMKTLEVADLFEGSVDKSHSKVIGKNLLRSKKKIVKDLKRNVPIIGKQFNLAGLFASETLTSTKAIEKKFNKAKIKTVKRVNEFSDLVKLDKFSLDQMFPQKRGGFIMNQRYDSLKFKTLGELYHNLDNIGKAEFSLDQMFPQKRGGIIMNQRYDSVKFKTLGELYHNANNIKMAEFSFDQMFPQEKTGFFNNWRYDSLKKMVLKDLWENAVDIKTSPFSLNSMFPEQKSGYFMGMRYNSLKKKILNTLNKGASGDNLQFDKLSINSLFEGEKELKSGYFLRRKYMKLKSSILDFLVKNQNFKSIFGVDEISGGDPDESKIAAENEREEKEEGIRDDRQESIKDGIFGILDLLKKGKLSVGGIEAPTLKRKNVGLMAKVGAGLSKALPKILPAVGFIGKFLTGGVGLKAFLTTSLGSIGSLGVGGLLGAGLAVVGTAVAGFGVGYLIQKIIGTEKIENFIMKNTPIGLALRHTGLFATEEDIKNQEQIISNEVSKRKEWVKKEEEKLNANMRDVMKKGGEGKRLKKHEVTLVRGAQARARKAQLLDVAGITAGKKGSEQEKRYLEYLALSEDELYRKIREETANTGIGVLWRFKQQGEDPKILAKIEELKKQRLKSEKILKEKANRESKMEEKQLETSKKLNSTMEDVKDTMVELKDTMTKRAKHTYKQVHKVGVNYFYKPGYSIF